MEFRFPDGIGDRYHFVPSVAKRSGLIRARRPRPLSISANPLSGVYGMCKETSFVCKLDAISAAQRARHSELAARLADAISERRELADGYEVRSVAEKIGLAALAGGITLERRSCPFL